MIDACAFGSPLTIMDILINYCGADYMWLLSCSTLVRSCAPGQLHAGFHILEKSEIILGTTTIPLRRVSPKIRLESTCVSSIAASRAKPAHTMMSLTASSGVRPCAAVRVAQRPGSAARPSFAHSFVQRRHVRLLALNWCLRVVVSSFHCCHMLVSVVAATPVESGHNLC